jgi:hypothetical protein
MTIDIDNFARTIRKGSHIDSLAIIYGLERKDDENDSELAARINARMDELYRFAMHVPRLQKHPDESDADFKCRVREFYNIRD